MGNTKNVTKVLFGFIIVTLLSFGFSKYLLFSTLPALTSKADAQIAVNQEQTSSPEGRLRLATAYFAKFHETKSESYLDYGVNILDEVNSEEFHIKNYLLGIFYLEKQEEDTALKYLEIYMQNQPMHQEALLAKGTALIRLGRNQEAIDTLKPFAKVRPDIADTFVLMSEAYQNLGDKITAKAKRNEAEELLGGDPDCIPGASEEKAGNETKPKN